VSLLPRRAERPLTDGSVIFTPDLFGPGITVNEVDYRMSSVDAVCTADTLATGLTPVRRA
jgi:hypothetical protein